MSVRAKSAISSGLSSSALASWCSVDIRGALFRPRSRAAMAVGLSRARSASASWVSPCAMRRSRSALPNVTAMPTSDSERTSWWGPRVPSPGGVTDPGVILASGLRSDMHVGGGGAGLTLAGAARGSGHCGRGPNAADPSRLSRLGSATAFWVDSLLRSWRPKASRASRRCCRRRRCRSRRGHRRRSRR